MQPFEAFCSENECGGRVLGLFWRLVISVLIGVTIFTVYWLAIRAANSAISSTGIDENLGAVLVSDPLMLAIMVLILIVSTMVNTFHKQDALSCLLGSLGLPGTILGILWAFRLSI